MPLSTPARRFALYAVLVFVVLTGGLSAFLQIRNADTLAAQQKSDDVNGCRAAFRVEFIDGPQQRALKAIGQGDDDGLAAALESADVDRYEDLVRLSRISPDRFLAACKRADPQAAKGPPAEPPDRTPVYVLAIAGAVVTVAWAITRELRRRRSSLPT